MAVRHADAEWKGTLKEGTGRMRLGSGAYDGPYSFLSRFEEGGGTNPEELIGAAHAGCFSMALSAALERAGTPVTRVATKATVHMKPVDGAPTITQVDLVCEGEVPGIDQAAFAKAAEDARKGCIVSRALAGVATITVDARLK
jgi:osmotically inducible protein OsmC